MSIFRAKGNRFSIVGVCACAFLSLFSASISLSAKDEKKSDGDNRFVYGAGVFAGYNFGDRAFSAVLVDLEWAKNGVPVEFEGTCKNAEFVTADQSDAQVISVDLGAPDQQVKYKFDGASSVMAAVRFVFRFNKFYVDAGPIFGMTNFKALGQDSEGEREGFEQYDQRCKSGHFGVSVGAGYQLNDFVLLYGRFDYLFGGEVKIKKNKDKKVVQLSGTDGSDDESKEIDFVPCEIACKVGGLRLTVGAALSYKMKNGFVIGARGCIGYSGLGAKKKEEKKEENGEEREEEKKEEREEEKKEESESCSGTSIP